MAVVVLAFVGLVAKTATGRGGDEAPDDPWGGQTLEWATASPAPRDNFAEVGSVMSPEPLLDSTAEPDEEGR
jgi:cytochrome c oxidase subunit 1/cytochrome c oxidase subunit I+III